MPINPFLIYDLIQSRCANKILYTCKIVRKKKKTLVIVYCNIIMINDLFLKEYDTTILWQLLGLKSL